MGLRRSIIRQVTLLNNTNVELCGPSSKRVRLVFPRNGDAALMAFSTGVMSTIRDGLIMQSGGDTVILDVEKDGDCVQQAWYCRLSGSGQVWTFLEVLEF